MVSGAQSSMKYSVGLQGYFETSFIPSLPVKGKHGHCDHDFAHIPCCMLLLLLLLVCFLIRTDTLFTT
jgi:hypothetical protein